MTTIQPDGEMIRKAVKWISEERQTDQSKKHQQMIEEAAIRFNLSPMEVEYLNNFLKVDRKHHVSN
ncbi:MAG: hypothetical protein JRI64_01845 [Deltaproteobacteria bacterium]|nr:hypothetical protein [Deltaproteobacteria bacterium]